MERRSRRLNMQSYPSVDSCSYPAAGIALITRCWLLAAVVVWEVVFGLKTEARTVRVEKHHVYAGCVEHKISFLFFFFSFFPLPSERDKNPVLIA